MLLDVRKKSVFLSIFFASVAVLWAGGKSAPVIYDLPTVHIASYAAQVGRVELAVDWSRVKKGDLRTFAVYRSSGAKAADYQHVTDVTPANNTYIDTGATGFTEYHYILEGALPNKKLPSSIKRASKEQREELLHPECAIVNGALLEKGASTTAVVAAKGGKIVNQPPDAQPDRPAGNAENSSGWNMSPVPGAPSQNTAPQYVQGAPIYITPPYTENAPQYVQIVPPQTAPIYTVPPNANQGVTEILVMPKESAPIYGGGGVYFSMGFFSGRIMELCDENGVPCIVNMEDGAASLALSYLFDANYTRSPFQGTALWYGIHNALNRIATWNNNNFQSFDDILLVTITDELDSASLDPSFLPLDNLTFRTSASYRDYIKNELQARRFSGKNIRAVSIGLRGRGSASNEFNAALQASSNGTSNAFILDSGNLDNLLQEVAAPTLRNTAGRSYGIVTPIYAGGTQIFISLDNAKAPIKNSGTSFLEGRVNVAGNTFYLDNLIFRGQAEAIPAPSMIYGERVGNGIEWKFNFSNALPRNITLFYKTDKVWLSAKDFSIRQYSESVPQKRTLIYLLLDNSISMDGANYAMIKSAVSNFITHISNAVSVTPKGKTTSMLSMRTAPIKNVVPIVHEAVVVQEAPPIVIQTPTVILPSQDGYGAYWVQTSSHENLYLAEDAQKLLAAYSLRSFIAKSFVQGKTYYRVRVGPYATIADAKLVAEYVKSPPLGFFDSFVP